MNELQLAADGRLRHLITLAGLPRTALERLLDRAEAMRRDSHGGARPLDLLAGRTLINLFFEPSTRTRTSFDLAAQRLGALVINFDIERSSTVKGESLLDTIDTLEAMHTDAFVVRHKESGTPETIARHLRTRAAVLNAGDGNHAHPTQGLLDALTLSRHVDDFSKLSVVICGDIRHSRVARSDVHVLRTLGVRDLRLCAPAELLPDADSAEFGQCTLVEDFDTAVAGCDAAIMLRLQKERMEAAAIPSEAEYFARYGLTAARLARAKPGCRVMHPGPINRNVEIADEVADGAQSLILEQVANGVFARMAVLTELLESR
ncbi:MAG: aspartate carbamoyltransferase catalytic subunit [Rudaea sp.]|uniref:aspartate carbamoyltransferase catalytic subunit n=1 Tax=unclassified Rudaea TaxID=2627037 RepID=UPI0010F6D3CB|nr:MULTISPECIES: aspartate carbamoyltransferase catalytic subunit [unclassified Rudaea]MBN8888317.1 aspartate carbamoyltransferase catalytic subunit [Rudaea sp.]